MATMTIKGTICDARGHDGFIHVFAPVGLVHFGEDVVSGGQTYRVTSIRGSGDMRQTSIVRLELLP